MKEFYIVPNTKTYYDSVKAETSEDALIDFTNRLMDTDMSAYFEAKDTKPMHYPHAYKYPGGRFEAAMSIIVATMCNDKKSVYYDEKALSGVNLSAIEAIGSLQKAYDDLCEIDKSAARQSRKHYYKALRSITGFGFDKKSDKHEVIRIKPNNSIKEACDILNSISKDIDGGGRIMVERQHMKKARKLLDKHGIDFDII